MEANFTRHPQSHTIVGLEPVRLVRYQENPAYWGPGKKAAKRKRSSEGQEEPSAKH
jgi:tRNA (guanine26-N2/guanine27-N2)-dimethyltransferase